MLKEISVINFKCFDSFTLPLNHINVLSGVNGVGKSTLIQSILLLRQSFLRDKTMRHLVLNGKYVELGTGQDILFEKAADDCIGLGYALEEEKHFFEFEYMPDSDVLTRSNFEEFGPVPILFSNRFVYLSAYRIAPQALYGVTNEENLQNREFGNNGEYALQYLSLFGDEDVKNSSVVLEDKLGRSLNNQTRLWMDKISPGVSPNVTINTQLRTSEVRYEFIEGTNKTNSYKSINVGFGITYVLPMIISILSAEKGDIVIVENPEAHIHPAGQRMLGELIARAGAGGVQVIVETHSDHILNGIRLTVKRGLADKDIVQLNFFYKDMADNYKLKYVDPKILKDGRLDIWPEGFFDEWDNTLYQLI